MAFIASPRKALKIVPERRAETKSKERKSRERKSKFTWFRKSRRHEENGRG
jgi:hypothetical protein